MLPKPFDEYTWYWVAASVSAVIAALALVDYHFALRKKLSTDGILSNSKYIQLIVHQLCFKIVTILSTHSHLIKCYFRRQHYCSNYANGTHWQQAFAEGAQVPGQGQPHPQVALHGNPSSSHVQICPVGNLGVGGLWETGALFNTLVNNLMKISPDKLKNICTHRLSVSTCLITLRYEGCF